MADGISLEQRGIPAVSVCTDKFRVTADAMARLHGFPDYRYVTVPHPVASLALPEILALADAILPEVLAILEVAI